MKVKLPNIEYNKIVYCLGRSDQSNCTAAQINTKQKHIIKIMCRNHLYAMKISSMPI